MKKILVVLISIIMMPFIITNFFYGYKDEKKESKLVIKEVKKEENKQETLIRVLRSNGNIEYMNIEDYLVGVVASEMPALYEEEALKAQAVAARTYALKKIENNYNNEYDVTDDVKTQVYQSDEMLREKWGDEYDRYIDKITKCVGSTKGEYLTYDNEIIYAFFFSFSNGKTEDNINVFGEDLPYLKSVDSSFDKDANEFEYQVTYNLEIFYNKLGLPYSDTLEITNKELTESNRVKSITINNQTYTGTEIRSKLSLRSTDFEFEDNGPSITIKTKGYGHGVGLSQYGANALAKQKKGYKEILKYYYQGTNLEKL